MAQTTKPAKAAETDDYSASQAPDTQESADGQERGDPRLVPGGAAGAPAAIGFTAMNEADVPSRALKPDQLDVRDSPDDEGRNR